MRPNRPRIITSTDACVGCGSGSVPQMPLSLMRVLRTLDSEKCELSHDLIATITARKSKDVGEERGIVVDQRQRNQSVAWMLEEKVRSSNCAARQKQRKDTSADLEPR